MMYPPEHFRVVFFSGVVLMEELVVAGVRGSPNSLQVRYTICFNPHPPRRRPANPTRPAVLLLAGMAPEGSLGANRTNR